MFDGRIKLFVSDPTTAVGGMSPNIRSEWILLDHYHSGVRGCDNITDSVTREHRAIHQSRYCQAITKIQINECGEAVITYSSMVIGSRKAMGLII